MSFEKIKHFLISLSLILAAYLIFKYVYPQPRNWYDHYRYLAQAFSQGQVYLTDLPSYYQDSVTIEGKVYIPFPPSPALILLPFIKLIPSITQQQVSIILGAVGVGMMFFLLRKFTDTKNSFLLSLFLAFGTVYFWASVVGTTWYFAHIVAFLFLTLSLIFFFKKKYILAGVLFSLAVCARLPIFAGVIFFALELYKEKGRFFKFMIPALLCIPILLSYNFIRFGSLTETGYVKVYEGYIHAGYPFTIRQLSKSDASYFGYLDPRNIPMHVFTFLTMPPVVTQKIEVSPSPYGMGIIFTSPLLFLALLPNLKKSIERNLFIGALGVASVEFLHYTQGWVQFGYRFAIDFLPFLLVILAIKFKPKMFNILLLVFSIIVCSWGVSQGIKLGW